MKFKLLIILGLLIDTSIEGYSQQPLKWRIGDWGELYFNGPQTTPMLSLDTLRTYGSNSPYFDDNGTLTLFSNGIAVMNSAMDTIQSGFLNYNTTYTYPILGSNVINGTIILPRPGYPNQQYIFHSSFQSPISPSIEFYGDLYFSIIDMSLNSGAGGVTIAKDILLNDSVWFGNINAVRHGNGRDWWLITGKHLSDTIYTWLVLQDTILGPYGQKKGMMYPGGHAANQTAFNQTGDKFAIGYVYQTGSIKKLLLSDFNRCTGELNNGIYLTMLDSSNMGYGIYGLEFSQSGRYLYASSHHAVNQFDLYAGNIQASSIRVGFHDHLPNPFQSSFGNMKLAPNGKIYMQTGAGNYSLDVINNPDSVGIACDIQLRQIDYNALFGTYMNVLCLPHYPNYNLGELSSSTCDSLTSLNFPQTNEIPIYVWPNPTENILNISFQKQIETGTVKISNVLGETVLNQSISPQSESIRLDIPHISNGIYIIKCSWKGESTTIKFIKN